MCFFIVYDSNLLHQVKKVYLKLNDQINLVIV